jgi:putative Mg2+ transporter-C (MgtC) family protein
MHQFPISLEAELIGRLLLAALLGSVLGWERQMGRHPAGLRTHTLVSLGAAAYTIAGVYGVAGFGTVQDAGRVSAQIITGIGFLGAGTIWRSSGEEGVIRGLTTAATIWVAAAIGMLTAYGLYVLAAGTALISLGVLRMLKQVEHAPRTIGGAVARQLRRHPARTPNIAYQPARAPSTLETPPNGEALAGSPAGGSTAAGDDDDTLAVAQLPERPRKMKHLRKGKKGKRKHRDVPTESVDQISDEPEPSPVGRP